MSTPLFVASDLRRWPAWLLQATTGRLPLSAQLWLARLRSRLTFRFQPQRKRVVRSIQSFYPGRPEDAERLALRHLQYGAQMKLLRDWVMGHPANSLQIAVKGRDHLDEAFAGSKGVILVTLHFGYGRLLKHAVRQLGRQAWDVGAQGAAAPPESRFASFVRRRLLRLAEFHAADANDLPADINLRPLLRALAANEALVIPLDGSKAAGIEMMPIFGRLHPLTAGPISIAAGTGSALLPVFLVDHDGDASRLELLIGEPLAVGQDEAGKPLLREALARFVAQAEDVLTGYPHLYNWRRLRESKKTASRSESYLESLERGKASG